VPFGVDGGAEGLTPLSIRAAFVRHWDEAAVGPETIQEGSVMANKVIHVEVTGKNGSNLQRYYSDLFGWNFDTNNPGGYGIAPSAEVGVAAGVGDAPQGMDGGVTFYVAVPDVDKALARASELGGQVIVPKFSPGPGAVLGMFADPEGHVVGVTEA
jgi:uncharacterized protein